MISGSHLGFIRLLDALITTLFQELSVYSVNVPCRCCDLDFNLTLYKEGLLKPRLYSNQKLVWERCESNLPTLEQEYLLNEPCKLNVEQ